MKGEREMSICEMQKEYMVARTDLRRYQAERDSFQVMEKEAAIPRTVAKPALSLPTEQTAQQPPGASAANRAPIAGGLGGYYCSLLRQLSPRLRKLVLPKDLQAAERPQAGGQRPLPPSAGYFANSTSFADADMRVKEAQRRQNRMGVEIQKKFSLAFACIVFVLVGAPIALRFPRGGVGLVIGVSFIVFATYYVALIGGEELANRSYLSPFWAMWGANVIFVIAGMILIARMGHESATNRGGGFGTVVDATRDWFARRRGDRRSPG
jgi:hypothetical protein